MLQAIAAGKKKNDRVDARKIADLLRCDYFPECHMAPREIRDRRRVLRYRNLLVRQAVQKKKKGVSFPCRREFPESTRFRGNARPFLLCYRWNSTTTPGCRWRHLQYSLCRSRLCLAKLRYS